MRPTLTATMMIWGATLMAKKASSWLLKRPTRIVSMAIITTRPARASITGKARVNVRRICWETVKGGPMAG